MQSKDLILQLIDQLATQSEGNPRAGVMVPMPDLMSMREVISARPCLSLVDAYRLGFELACRLGGHVQNGADVRRVIDSLDLPAQMGRPSQHVDVGAGRADAVNQAHTALRSALATLESNPVPVAANNADQFTWCSPGDSQARRWLLVFEDKDKTAHFISSEADAYDAFCRADAGGWNCHLLVSALRNPAAGQAFHTDQALAISQQHNRRLQAEILTLRELLGSVETPQTVTELVASPSALTDFCADGRMRLVKRPNDDVHPWHVVLRGHDAGSVAQASTPKEAVMAALAATSHIPS